jgi:alpha-beta hydrolase superfamily lysophospholipase
MCPPLLADHPFSYRREFLLAEELARRGVAVWRFHYAGTGYSDGSGRSVALTDLEDDARLIVDYARAASSAPVAIGGTRCGAIVAAAVGKGHQLVLWEPVIDGSTYIREGFRARMIADGGQLQRQTPTARELVEELHRTGSVDLLGYSLYETLHDSIAGCRLVELLDTRRDPVLIIAADPAAELVRYLDGRLTVATAGTAEAWWFHRTQQWDPATVAGRLARVIDPWLRRAPEPATFNMPEQVGSRVCTFLEVGDTDVFALFTPPSGTPRHQAALLLWGGGGIPAFGRNRVAMSLASRLAGIGYHVLQLDYPGRGESSGPEPADPMDETSVQAVFAAARAAYEWLRSRGLHRVLAIGSCQGAAAALSTADSAGTLTGMVLLAPPVAECDTFGPVVASRTPVLIVYGIHDEGFQSFNAAIDGELGGMLRSAGGQVTMSLTDDRIHGYMTVSGQEAMVDTVMDWVERLPS